MCSVINGGYYYQPHLVTRIKDSSGGIVKTISPTLMKQTISEKISADIRSYMAASVDHGTSRTSKVQGYSSGGKTGTAEKLPRGNGKYLVSFIGFAPVDDPSYDLVSVKKDEGFVATATVALQPELKLNQISGFTSQCVTPEVTDKEIDAVLERRRNYAAELVPHKGPAVKGNVVHMDFEGLLDGVPFEGGTAKDQSVQLGSGRMIPGFEDGILGHKAGDEFEINVTFPKNYHGKELAGKPAVFKIKLHDVCVRQLPALNSDFAKKMGKETMEEYRAFVKKQLFDGRHGGALNHAKDMILGQLADAAEGEIPSILVENAYQQQMQVIQQQLQMQRMSLNTYLSQIHETRESFTAKVHAAAEKNTRARMALLQIAQQENLLPTDEEIDKQLAERAEKTKKTVEEIKANTDIAALRRNEGIRKAADWVIDHSTIEEKVESK